MPFIRKRDLNKKSNHQNAANTHQRVETLHSSNQSQSGSLNWHQQIQRLTELQDHLSDLELPIWQKQMFEILTYFLENKKALLTIHLLQAYRESMAAVAKYQQQLRKKGLELNQQSAGVTLGLFKRVVEEVNLLTKQQKNDSIIQQVNIYKTIFLNLELFAPYLQGEASKNQKRPSLMRKNSLKKIEELPTIRPSSRGKLSSLSKKDPALNKQEILGLKSKQEIVERGVIQDIVVGLCSIVKNMSANNHLRRQLLRQEYLRLINRYLCIWSDKNVSNTGSAVLSQLTASYRHLAVEEKSYKAFLQSNCIDCWARLIEVFPTNQQLVFNILRTLSKLSNYESVCNKLNQKKAFLKSLSSFFKFYKANIHIIIRIAIVFANMTSYLADIRSQLYFDFAAWKDIYECFSYYAGRQLSGKNQVEKMGLSMAAWDYQNIKKESDIECAIRIIRLIANIFTVSAIGQDIYVNDLQSYRELIKKMKGLLQKKLNIQKSSELIATILSCLTNILFYDKEMLMGNQEHRATKIQLVSVLVDFVVQIDNEEICCESLRVIANLTRIKEFCVAVIDAKIHEALLILLESTSKQIVYYCLGVLSNLMADNNFKQQFKQPVITGIISILNDCDNDDFDLVALALKTLSSVIDARNQNVDPRLLADIQNCLMNLGSHCDKVISSVTGGDTSDLQESRSLINLLLNSMPEQRFVCQVKNCGRRFADQAKLTDHVKRRHKA